MRWLSEFNCIVNTLGSHQGDLERVAVILSNDGNFTPLGVEFEAHGDVSIYAPARVSWVGNQPVVHVALNGHSLHNQAREDNPVVEDETPGIVAIISALADGTSGPSWNTAAVGDFRLLSLDGQGEAWSNYTGRLGIQQTNSLQSATYFDGSGLSGVDWAFVNLVNFLATLLDKYPDDIKTGNGPVGPGARSWITPPAAGTDYLGAGLVSLKGSTTSQGAGAIAYLDGRFLDTVKKSILQFWDNGNAAVIGYGFDGQGNMTELVNNPNLNQGPGAIAWLSGRFLGGEVEQVIQLWDNGGSLGMILYGLDQASSISELWSTGNTGQGSGAVAWLAGDFDGSGADKVLQCWGNGGSLAMILYGSDGKGGMVQTWSTNDTGQGPGAIAWLVGDFDGTGKDQVLQCWANGGSLGMVLYGSDGSGGLKALWSSSDLGQGPGAVAWLVGDFDGSGRDRVLQCWGSGTLGMILYGTGGDSVMSTLWTNSDMGQGAGAVAWLVGDFDGDGLDNVVQCWANGSSLAMIAYVPNGTGGMTQAWSSNDVGEGPGAVAWMTGNFTGRGRDTAVQLWGSGQLSSILYGTLVQD